MSDPIGVPVEAVPIIHDRQITCHIGASGLRDERLLQNALQRPLHARPVRLSLRVCSLKRVGTLIMRPAIDPR